MRIEKEEKRLHEEANDVPPFMDSKFKPVKRTTSLLKYSNLMVEFVYQSAEDEDNWDHSDRFDFKGILHKTTVLQLKEKFSLIIGCPAEFIGDFKFYDKKGKMTYAENDMRLFEAGITDGINIQMIKDEEKIAEVKAQK